MEARSLGSLCSKNTLEKADAVTRKFSAKKLFRKIWQSSLLKETPVFCEFLRNFSEQLFINTRRTAASKEASLLKRLKYFLKHLLHKHLWK